MHMEFQSIDVLTLMIEDQQRWLHRWTISLFIYLLLSLIFTVMVTIRNLSEGAGQFTKKSCEIIETVFIIVWKLYTLKVVENSLMQGIMGDQGEICIKVDMWHVEYTSKGTGKWKHTLAGCMLPFRKLPFRRGAKLSPRVGKINVAPPPPKSLSLYYWHTSLCKD